MLQISKGLARVTCLLVMCSSLVLSACFSTVPYVPTPVAADKALPNLELALTRYVIPKPERVEHGEGFTKVVFGGKYAGTRMLVYSEIANVRILQYPAAYQVATFDRQDKELERFQAESIEDAKKIADAINSVIRPGN